MNAARRPGAILARVLPVAVFVAVVALAAALTVSWGLIPGALGLLVPLAVWYAALSARQAEADRLDRMTVAAAAARPPLVRPEVTPRSTLEDGGTVGAPPWRS